MNKLIKLNTCHWSIFNILQHYICMGVLLSPRCVSVPSLRCCSYFPPSSLSSSLFLRMPDEITPQRRVDGSESHFADAVSSSFPLVRVFTRQPGTEKLGTPISAWLSFPSTIHWIPQRKSLKENLQFTSFRHAYCLTLDRLPHSVEWAAVTKAVYREEHEGALRYACAPENQPRVERSRARCHTEQAQPRPSRRMGQYRLRMYHPMAVTLQNDVGIQAYSPTRTRTGCTGQGTFQLIMCCSI